MTAASHLRVFRWDYILLAALSLSIGWGIRGDFGHEYGAMIPGCLTAIAIALMSGRQDWRERVAYFAAFGALGWGFGGSVSYMQVIAYTHSGDMPTQVYGFFGLFLIGFLWAGMGGAGTAFPAVAHRDLLTSIFKPLCWVFAFWLFKKWAVWPLAESWSESYTATLNRQESPLYWFDADWTEAFTALLAICCYDLYERRFGGKVPPRILWGLGAALTLYFVFLYFFIPASGEYQIAGFAYTLPNGVKLTTPFAGWNAGPGILLLTLSAAVLLITACAPILTVFAAVGGVLGYATQQIITTSSALREPLLRILVHRQGDAAAYQQAAGLKDQTLEQITANFMLNWPQFLDDRPEIVGLTVGVLLGCAIYFAWRGKFRNGASLFLYMSLGWLLSFILFPTLLGIRLTPPRSDDWAGILGVFLGTQFWLIRNRLLPVAWTSWVCGILGGLSFAGAACLKLLMVFPGNKERAGLSPESIQFWNHYQSANWHSFLEQSYGFFNGLAIAVAMGLLAMRVGPAQGDRNTRRWTQVLAVAFVLFLLLYVNIYKNVPEFVSTKRVAATLNAPLLPLIPLSQTGEASEEGAGEIPAQDQEPARNLFEFATATWFNVVWLGMSAAGIYLMARHLRKPVAVVPSNWLGKGQLLYLVFLWAMVIANFERAIPGFHESRLLTEWVIFLNAIIVSLLILSRPQTEGIVITSGDTQGYGERLYMTILGGLPAAALVLLCFFGLIRLAYHDHFIGHAGKQFRFGEQAEWRIHPIIKGGEHR